jgi:hypothetical protein
MLSGIGSTIIGTAVGSAIGHTVGRRLNDAIDSAFGSGNEPTAVEQESTDLRNSNDVCYFQVQDLTNCLKENANNRDFCSYFAETLKECRQRQQQQQQY